MSFSEELEGWISCFEHLLTQFGVTKQTENTYGGANDCNDIYEAPDELHRPPRATRTSSSSGTGAAAYQSVDLSRKGSITSDSTSAKLKRDVPLPGLPCRKQPATPPPERDATPPSPVPPAPPPRSLPSSAEIPQDWITNPFVFPIAPPLPPRDKSPPSTPLVPSTERPPVPRPRTQRAEPEEDLYGCAWGDEGDDSVYGCAWEEAKMSNGQVDSPDLTDRTSTVRSMITQLDSMTDKMSKLDLYLHHAGVTHATPVDEIEEDVYGRLESKLEAMEEWDQLSELRTRRNQSVRNVFKPNPDPPPFEASAEPVHVAGFFEKKVGIRGAGEVVDHKSVKEGMLTVQRTASSSASSANSLFITAGPDASLSALAGAVESLKKQILSPGGVAVKIQADDLRNRVALVEIENRVWIGGWDPRLARLHHILHIGDQVMGVNERVIPIDNLKTFWKMLDAHPVEDGKISLRLRRLPYAKVVAIRRDHEGQGLDLVRVGGTNEISYIKQGGLVAQHGLSTLCKNFDPANCGFLEGNWFLTEVNGRTLSLFYKNNEVEVALNAYGREISIVVQPADFVKRLKKALKSVKRFKGYVGYQ